MDTNNQDDVLEEGTSAAVKEDKVIEGQVNLSTDLVDKWISDNKDGEKWLQSILDRRVTQALDTFKKKTVPTLLQERENKIREELLPKETPEQKMLANIIKEREQEKRQSRRTEMENYAIKKANTMGLEGIGDQIEYFISDQGDEADILKRLEWVKQRDIENFERGRGSFLKDNSRVPSAGDNDEGTPLFRTVAEYGRYLQKTKKPYDRVLFEKIAEFEKSKNGGK